MSTINEIIKQRRKELNMTQKELAEILSVSDKTVSRWESGNQVPDALLLPDISSALNISLNDLYGIKEQVHSTTNNDSIDCCSQTKVKHINKIQIIYKVCVIIGLFLIFFGAVFLLRADIISGTIKGRTIGKAIFFGGCIISAIACIGFSFIRKKHSENYNLLVDDITYNGFYFVFVGFLLLWLMPLFYGFNHSLPYEIITFLIAILFQIIFLLRKKDLLNLGINISKTLTRISLIICISSVVLYAISPIIAPIIVKIITKDYEIVYLDDWNYKCRFYLYLLSGFMFTISLLINYIELIFKAKYKYCCNHKSADATEKMSV